MRGNKSRKQHKIYVIIIPTILSLPFLKWEIRKFPGETTPFGEPASSASIRMEEGGKLRSDIVIKCTGGWITLKENARGRNTASAAQTQTRRFDVILIMTERRRSI